MPGVITRATIASACSTCEGRAMATEAGAGVGCSAPCASGISCPRLAASAGAEDFTISSSGVAATGAALAAVLLAGIAAALAGAAGVDVIGADGAGLSIALPETCRTAVAAIRTDPGTARLVTASCASAAGAAVCARCAIGVARPSFRTGMLSIATVDTRESARCIGRALFAGARAAGTWPIALPLDASAGAAGSASPLPAAALMGADGTLVLVAVATCVICALLARTGPTRTDIACTGAAGAAAVARFGPFSACAWADVIAVAAARIVGASKSACIVAASNAGARVLVTLAVARKGCLALADSAAGA